MHEGPRVPPAEVQNDVISVIGEELESLGASPREIEDVTRAVLAYLDIYWARLGISMMATSNKEAFERHVRRHATRYWRARLKMSLSTAPPGGGRRWADPVDERTPEARLRLFKLMDEADLTKHYRNLIELMWVWGMTRAEVAETLGLSNQEVILDLRDAFTIIHGRATEEGQPTDR